MRRAQRGAAPFECPSLFTRYNPPLRELRGLSRDRGLSDMGLKAIDAPIC
jgi:hypothetical protein